MYHGQANNPDAQRNYGPGCGGATAGPFPGSLVPHGPAQELADRHAKGLAEGLKGYAGQPNTINKPSELEAIKDRLRHVCEQAANVRLRVRYTNDKLYGPSIEKAGPDADPIAEGPALNTIACLINEASRMLSDTQAELARLEML